MKSNLNRQKLKNILRGYRKMTFSLRRQLEQLGFRVYHAKKHWRLELPDKNRCIFLPTTSSDCKSGWRIIAKLAKEL